MFCFISDVLTSGSIFQEGVGIAFVSVNGRVCCRQMENLETAGRSYSSFETSYFPSAAAQKKRRRSSGVALTVAAIIALSAAVYHLPHHMGKTSLIPLPQFGALAADRISSTSITESFLADDKLVTLKLSDLEQKNAMIRRILQDEAMDALSGGNPFTSYISVLSVTEAKERMDSYKSRIAAEKAAEEKAAILNERARSSANQNGYVRLNWDGYPMSQKKMPDWLELDENGVPTHYKQLITGNATAYYGDPITATGTVPEQGTVAVDPRKIPYGTKMWITSADGKIVYGYAIAEDTGGFIYYRNGATVDLFMHQYNDCVSWGWRQANIYILE